MWGIRYGRWWAVQWRFDGCLSFGVHVDFRSRPHAKVGHYGPYVDLHLAFWIFSLGRNPAYSGELDRLLPSARGGAVE